MADNMMCPAHKANTKNFNDNYERTFKKKVKKKVKK